MLPFPVVHMVYMCLRMHVYMCSALCNFPYRANHTCTACTPSHTNFAVVTDITRVSAEVLEQYQGQKTPRASCAEEIGFEDKDHQEQAQSTG